MGSSGITARDSYIAITRARSGRGKSYIYLAIIVGAARTGRDIRSGAAVIRQRVITGGHCAGHMNRAIPGVVEIERLIRARGVQHLGIEGEAVRSRNQAR